MMIIIDIDMMIIIIGIDTIKSTILSRKTAFEMNKMNKI